MPLSCHAAGFLGLYEVWGNASCIRSAPANDGKLSGPMDGAPVLLLTTTGRTSGNAHTTPVGFIDASGKLAVAAANGGSEQHPDWYRNIEATST